MRVMGVSPIQRLVVPRVLACIGAAVLLNGLVSVVGVLGGYFFNVVVQGGTPGAYLASFTALAQIQDLYVGELKAVIFGFIAGVVACHRGLNTAPRPQGCRRLGQPVGRHHLPDAVLRQLRHHHAVPPAGARQGSLT